MFETVTHDFSIGGHSFSPCDRNSGFIKCVLKKQYAELLLKVSKTLPQS